MTQDSACLEKNFDCHFEKCCKHFNRAHQLQRHIRKVHEKPFACDLCPSTFGKLSHWRRHVCYAHIEEPVEALQKMFLKALQLEAATSEHCLRLRVAYENALKNHIIGTVGQEQTEADQSVIGTLIQSAEEQDTPTTKESVHSQTKESTTESLKDLLKAKSLVYDWGSEAIVYICLFPDCHQLQFTTYAQLKYHWKSHINKKTYCCTECSNLEFDRYSDFRKHVKSKHQNYTCPVCSSTFSGKAKFQKHCNMSGHRNKVNLLLDDFTCSDCNKLFHSKQGLKDHTRRKHGDLKDAFACKECTYVTDLKQSLQRHVKCKHPLFTPGNEQMTTKRVRVERLPSKHVKVEATEFTESQRVENAWSAPLYIPVNVPLTEEQTLSERTTSQPSPTTLKQILTFNFGVHNVSAMFNDSGANTDSQPRQNTEKDAQRLV